ncbi:MAG TPA: MlaD family protein [Acidimicrobiales bacterium]|nr:MlaD family protein [Acidimicrobiales bacterium]
MSPRLRRLALVPVAMAMAAVGLAGCSGGSGGTLDASATFPDVSDLVAGAPVQYANITVGSVKSITLSHDEAHVVMTIERSADVPGDVTAQLRQTSILGQHYVSLVSTDRSGTPLHDGSVISKTEFVPGIQQLVQSGAAVFGAVNAAQLAQIVDNGAQGFGGQAASIKQLISDFDTILAGYASRSSEIKSVIDNLNQFNATLAPNAQQDAQAISNLAQTTQVLADQSSQFEQLLQSLNDLAVQGHSILSTGLSQTEDQINALAAVASQLYQHQRDLATVIDELPAHNSALGSLVVNNFAQILEDIIVCGVPASIGGANNTPDATCNPSGGS